MVYVGYAIIMVRTSKKSVLKISIFELPRVENCISRLWDGRRGPRQVVEVKVEVPTHQLRSRPMPRHVLSGVVPKGAIQGRLQGDAIGRLCVFPMPAAQAPRVLRERPAGHGHTVNTPKGQSVHPLKPSNPKGLNNRNRAGSDGVGTHLCKIPTRNKGW